MQEYLIDVIEKPSEFKFSYYLSKAWDIFFKAPGTFIGGLLVGIVISYVINFIPGEVGWAVSLIFNSIYTGGYYIVSKNIVHNQSVSVNDFLLHLKS